MPQNEDDFSNMDQRVNDIGQAAFGRRTLSIPIDGNSPTAYSNDKSRVSRATFEHDGSVTHQQSGVLRGTVDTSVKDNTSPFAFMKDRSNTRAIQPSELTLDSVVTLRNGSVMALRHALDAGYVQQRADGSYVSGSAGVQSGPQKHLNEPPKQEVHPDLVTEAFPIENRAADETLNALVQTTQPTTQLGAISDVIESSFGPDQTGSISEHNVTQLATQLGVEPEAVNEKLAPVMAAFQAQGDALVESFGMVPQEFYAWAKDNRGSELSKAMHKHGTMRQTSGYTPIIKDYVSRLDTIAPDKILGADLGPGISVRKDDQGRIVLKLPQGEMLWSSAIKANLIKLSRNK